MCNTPLSHFFLALPFFFLLASACPSPKAAARLFPPSVAPCPPSCLVSRTKGFDLVRPRLWFTPWKLFSFPFKSDPGSRRRLPTLFFFCVDSFFPLSGCIFVFFSEAFLYYVGLVSSYSPSVFFPLAPPQGCSPPRHIPRSVGLVDPPHDLFFPRFSQRVPGVVLFRHISLAIRLFFP